MPAHRTYRNFSTHALLNSNVLRVDALGIVSPTRYAIRGLKLWFKTLTATHSAHAKPYSTSRSRHSSRRSFPLSPHWSPVLRSSFRATHMVAPLLDAGLSSSRLSSRPLENGRTQSNRCNKVPTMRLAKQGRVLPKSPQIAHKFPMYGGTIDVRASYSDMSVEGAMDGSRARTGMNPPSDLECHINISRPYRRGQ